MSIIEHIKEKLSEIEIKEVSGNLVASGFLKALDETDGNVQLAVEIPVSLRHLRSTLKNQCEEKLSEIPGIKAVEITFKFQVQKIPEPTPTPKKGIPALSRVKNIIAIASGKGGVGKSTVTANLAAAFKAQGAKVGIMDLDIYGPSMNMMFGITESPQIDANKKLFPVIQYGMPIVSMAMFTDENSAVIWRGPMVSQMVQNFLSNVHWGELDYLFLDLPPGTGDIQLTLTQMAPLTGAVIVTTPQEVSLIDAKKGLKMFEKVSVPVIGVIENMSKFIGDDGKEYHIFQSGGGSRIAHSQGVPFCGEIPLHPDVSKSGDAGKPIVMEDPLNPVSKAYTQISQILKERLSILGESKDILTQYDYSWDNLPTAAV